MTDRVKVLPSKPVGFQDVPETDTTGPHLTVLCDDGSIWWREVNDPEKEWIPFYIHPASDEKGGSDGVS